MNNIGNYNRVMPIIKIGSDFNNQRNKDYRYKKVVNKEKENKSFQSILNEILNK